MPTSPLVLARPKKEETLARKAEKRTRRLLLWRKLVNFSPRWWWGTREIICLFILLAINFFLLAPFFGQEDQTNVFSAPLVPTLAQAISPLVPYTFGIRFWLVIFLLALPLPLYFFIRAISRRRLIAFATVLLTSLPVGIFLPVRVKLGLFTQDGSQVASLTLICLVCLSLYQFLRKGDFWIGVASALGMTLVALTSPLGMFILACFALALTFSEMLLGGARIKFLRLTIVAILAGGFSAFWYNPKFAFLILESTQGQLLKGILFNLLPLSFFIVPILGVFGFLLFENQPQLQPLFLAVFLTIDFGLLTLGAGMSLANPSRLLPALGLSVAFLGGILLSWFFDFFQKIPTIRRLSLVNRYRQLTLYLLMFLFVCLIFIIIDVSLGSFRDIAQDEFNEAWEVKRIGLWQVRDKADGIASILGYLITFLTLGLVIFLGVKLNKKPARTGEGRQ